MIKRTVTYTDYNGNKRTEDFYFHLNEAELVEMQLTTAGGLAERLQKIIDASDLPTIVTMFKGILLKSYGIPSDDGRRFKKSPEIREAFEQSEPYSILFMKLATDNKYAAEFCKGIIPAKGVKLIPPSDDTNLDEDDAKSNGALS